MDDEQAPLDRVGKRVPDAVVGAWERATLDSPLTWPADEHRYRHRPPAADPAAGLDALAAVLDESERVPEQLFVHLDVGRRAEFGQRRRKLMSLSGHADVVVADEDTAGTVPLTGETFDALATLFEDVRYALVRDEVGDAIVEYRDETLRFTLPDADGLELATAAIDRLE